MVRYGAQGKPKACIFCGRSPINDGVKINKEHIFSRRRLERLMPGTGSFGHLHHREGTDGDFDKWWDHHEPDLVVRCVCEKCNGGWMDRIDEEAAALVEPMALGCATQLATLAEQTLLAGWAFKLALMFDHKQGKPLIETATHKHFYETFKPSPGSQVWLSRTIPPRFVAGAHVLAWTAGDGDEQNAFFCAVFLNHLIAHVFIPLNNAPRGIHVDMNGNAAFVRQIWPLSLMKIVWPPEGVIPFDKVYEFIEALPLSAPL